MFAFSLEEVDLRLLRSSNFFNSFINKQQKQNANNLCTVNESHLAIVLIKFHTNKLHLQEKTGITITKNEDIYKKTLEHKTLQFFRGEKLHRKLF